MDHLLKILEIAHFSSDQKIIWSSGNLLNILHNSGKEFVLKTLFTGEESIPTDYYIGLDSRATLTAAQTMANLSEPSGSGYTRQTVSSSGDFNYDSIGLVKTSLLTFLCTSGSYSVKNVFLTTEPDDTGFLISSVPLTENRTLTSGETLTLRAGFSLS